MKKTPIVTGAASAIGMLLLILDSKTALSGAQEGLSLCIRTVVPSLFPFFVLSILLTGSLMGVNLPLLRPIGNLMGIPQGAESILIAGFLGGYPVGAQAVGSAVRNGQLSSMDARRMLAFCNNAGPAFLFGMASSLFPRLWMAWLLWCIHILSAIIVSVLLPGKSSAAVMPACSAAPTIPEAMLRALRIMAQVCGWVILFRVIITFFSQWFGWLLPDTVQVIVSGILELSNGCCALGDIENTGLRFILCSGFLAFGGICVSMQTVSVADGLDMTLYLPGKLAQTLLSLSLSMLLQPLLPEEMTCAVPILVPAFLIIATISSLLLSNIRKKSGNPAPLGV